MISERIPDRDNRNSSRVLKMQSTDPLNATIKSHGGIATWKTFKEVKVRRSFYFESEDGKRLLERKLARSAFFNFRHKILG